MAVMGCPGHTGQTSLARYRNCKNEIHLGASGFANSFQLLAAKAIRRRAGKFDLFQAPRRAPAPTMTARAIAMKLAAFTD